MNAISAAIITVGGLLALVFCGFIGHSDTQLFMGFVSFAVMGIGLITWVCILRSDFQLTWINREEAATVKSDHAR